MKGYCGLECKKCPVYIATLNNDTLLKQNTANTWSETYNDYLKKNLEPEDMICFGCRADKGPLFIGCQICQIRVCCSEKGLNACIECESFQDCEIIQGFLAFNKLAE